MVSINPIKYFIFLAIESQPVGARTERNKVVLLLRHIIEVFKVYNLKKRSIIKTIMSKLFFLMVTLFLPFILVISVQSDSCRSNKMDDLSTKKDDPVMTGEWGGEHIGMQINEESADIDFDCANGRINQRITLDKNGKFDLTGTYTIERSGPTREDKPQPTYSARYVGTVKDKRMNLTVTLIDNKKDIGTFTLTHGTRARVMKCR
jgi:hypothetical protein